MSRHHVRLSHCGGSIVVVAGYDRPLRHLFLQVLRDEDGRPKQSRQVVKIVGVSDDQILDYEVFDGGIAITHTIVPQEIGGRGIAAALVKAALDHARAQGLKVDPQCSYADVWMRRHPEYEPLRV